MKSDDRRIDSLRLLHPLEISFGVMFGRRQLHQQKFKSEPRASANDTGTCGRVDTPSLSLCKHAVLAVVNHFSFSTPFNHYGSRLRKKQSRLLCFLARPRLWQIPGRPGHRGDWGKHRPPSAKGA